MAAQKEAAWSDVAKRMAHEINNPLTPIQLSAERIQKKIQRVIRRKRFHRCFNQNNHCSS